MQKPGLYPSAGTELVKALLKHCWSANASLSQADKPLQLCILCIYKFRHQLSDMVVFSLPEINQMLESVVKYLHSLQQTKCAVLRVKLIFLASYYKIDVKLMLLTLRDWTVHFNRNFSKTRPSLLPTLELISTVCNVETIHHNTPHGYFHIL